MEEVAPEQPSVFPPKINAKIGDNMSKSYRL